MEAISACCQQRPRLWRYSPLVSGGGEAGTLSPAGGQGATTPPSLGDDRLTAGDGGPLAGLGAGGGGAESGAEEVPGTLAVAALTEAAAGLAPSQQGGQRQEGDDVQELWEWGRASALGPPCFRGETPAPHPPVLTTSGQTQDRSHVLPLLTTLQAAAGSLGLQGGDVGEAMAGGPRASFTPHPALSTPAPPRWPQHHGDGGFQNMETAGGCRGERGECWKGGGGAAGLGPGAARPQGRPHLHRVQPGPGCQQSPPSFHIVSAGIGQEGCQSPALRCCCR